MINILGPGRFAIGGFMARQMAVGNEVRIRPHPERDDSIEITVITTNGTWASTTVAYEMLNLVDPSVQEKWFKDTFMRFGVDG